MNLQLFCLLAIASLAAAEVRPITWTLSWLDNVSVDPSLNSKRMIVINGTWWVSPQIGKIPRFSDLWRRIHTIFFIQTDEAIFYRPPPTTIVNKGDVIQLTVVNNLDVDTSITLHAHGFLQMNNNLYDGPEGVTQWCVSWALTLPELTFSSGIQYQQSFQCVEIFQYSGLN